MKDYKIIFLFTSLLLLGSCSTDIEVNVKEALHTCSKNDGSYSCSLNKTNLEKFSPAISDKVKQNLHNIELLNSISIYKKSNETFNTLDEYIDFTKNLLKNVIALEQQLIKGGEIEKTLSGYPRYAKKEIISTTKKQIYKTKTLLQEKINYASLAKQKCDTVSKGHIYNIAQKLSQEDFITKTEENISTKTFTYNDYENILKKSSHVLSQDYSKQIASWKIIVDNLRSDCFYSFEDGLYESLVAYMRKFYFDPSLYTFKESFDYEDIQKGFSSLGKQLTTALENEIAFYLKKHKKIGVNEISLQNFLQDKVGEIISQILGEPYLFLENVTLGNDYYEIYNESHIILPFSFKKGDIDNISSLTLSNTQTREKIIWNADIEFSSIYKKQNNTNTYRDILLKTQRFDIQEGRGKSFEVYAINKQRLKNPPLFYIYKRTQDDFYKTDIENNNYYGLELSKGLNRENSAGGEIGYTKQIGGDIQKVQGNYKVQVSSDDVISGQLFGRIQENFSIDAFQKNFEVLGIQGNIAGGLNIKKTANLKFHSRENIISKEGQLINNLLVLNTFNSDFGIGKLKDSQIRALERVKESLGKKKLYTSLFQSTIDYKLINNLLHFQFDLHKFIGEWFNYDLVQTAGIGGGFDGEGNIGVQGFSSVEGKGGAGGEWYYSLLKDNQNGYVYQYSKKNKVFIQYEYTPQNLVKQFISSGTVLGNAGNGLVQGHFFDAIGKGNAQLGNTKALSPRVGNINRNIQLHTKKEGDIYKVEKIVDTVSDPLYFSEKNIFNSGDNHGIMYTIESDYGKGNKIDSLLGLQGAINTYIENEGNHFLNIYKKGLITEKRDLTVLYNYLKSIPNTANYSFSLSFLGGKSPFDKENEFILSEFLTDTIIDKGQEVSTSPTAILKDVRDDEEAIKNAIIKINKRLEKRGNTANKLKIEDYIGNTDKTVKITKKDRKEAKKFKKLHEGYKKKLRAYNKIVQKVSGIAGKLKLTDVKVQQKSTYDGNIQTFDFSFQDGNTRVKTIYSGFKKENFEVITLRYMNTLSNYIQELYEETVQ